MDQNTVRKLFTYKDGFLYYHTDGGHKNAGKLAGYTAIKKGMPRRRVRVLGKDRMASRVIFLYHNGYLPIIVDHIDRDTSNDKIENLRAATLGQNSANRKSSKKSTSKYLGVWYEKNDQNKKWMSAISSNKKVLKLGLFLTQEQAALAYNREAVRYHGEFANLNIIQPNNQ